MTYNILVPISPGEILDKITILQLKSEKIVDERKLQNVLIEMKILQETWQNSLFVSQDLDAQIKNLYQINSVIWDLEDLLRNKEKEKRFDEEFVDAARSIYVSNDKRARIKKEINEFLGSNIIEEKSYTNYD